MNEKPLGIFDINESAGPDDILKINIFAEEAEFKTNEFAFNPKTSGDNLPTSTMNPPGGRKEDPTSNEYDKGQSTTVTPPGGRNENPSATIYDKGQSVNISIPQGTTLDSRTYNAALQRLQQSYRESMEMMNMVGASLLELTNVTVVPISEEESTLNEAADIADEAMYQAILNSPLYEKVGRDDKDKVQDIVHKLSSQMESKVRQKGNNARFVRPKKILRALIDPNGLSNVLHTVWTQRLWQILGIVYMEENNIQPLLADLNACFKDELGEYKILASRAVPAFIDALRMRFNWKNAQLAWTLVIDKKLPGEFKKAEGDVDPPEKSEGSSSEDAKTEAADAAVELEGGAQRMNCPCNKEDHVVRNHKTQCKRCGRLIRADKSRLIGESETFEEAFTGFTALILEHYAPKHHDYIINELYEDVMTIDESDPDFLVEFSDEFIESGDDDEEKPGGGGKKRKKKFFKHAEKYADKIEDKEERKDAKAGIKYMKKQAKKHPKAFKQNLKEIPKGKLKQDARDMADAFAD